MADWLFVNTLEDIRLRSQDPKASDRYTLLGLAPLLRKMVMDRTNLFQPSASARHTKVAFRINPYVPAEVRPPLERVFALSRGEMIGTQLTPPVGVQRLSRTSVGEFEGEPVTVGDLIGHYAHVEGGVHFGRPEQPMSHMIAVMSTRIIEESPLAWVTSLAYIGQIVHAGLLPLQTSILESGGVELSEVFRERWLGWSRWRTAARNLSREQMLECGCPVAHNRVTHRFQSTKVIGRRSCRSTPLTLKLDVVSSILSGPTPASMRWTDTASRETDTCSARL
jgi:hypothetical protein